jgi:TonB family protein
MANARRRMSGWYGSLAAWCVVLAGVLPLVAGAQGMAPPTTVPSMEFLPEGEAPAEAPPVEAEVEVRRTEGGFTLEEGAPAFQPPALVEDSPARYPRALAAEGRAGTVRLELLVDAAGEVAEARLVQGVHPLLDEAALHAAPGLRFEPARVDGEPVPVRLHFEYRFEAPRPREGEEAPPPPVTLRGLVRAKGNRRPLPGAVLISDALPDTPFESTPDGRFEARLPEGTQWVRVTAPGYKPGAFREGVRADEVLEVVYGLEPLVVNPYETVVRGDRERTEVSRVSLQGAELREIPGTQGDPFRVVMLLPGVSSMLSGISYPVVRGSQPAATGYFLDGVRVPLLFHLFLGPAVIHPDFIDTIDFFPGNAPTRYGRLMGGAVEGRITRPRDDRVHGSAYADLLNAGLFIEYPFQSTGTNVSVAGRLSYTPWLIGLAATAFQPPPPAGQQNPRVVLDFYDYQARLEQQVGEGRTRLFAFGSSDTFGMEARSNNFGSTLLQSILFHRVDLRHRHPVGGGELEAGITLGLDRFAVRNEDPVGGGGRIHIDQRNASARLGYERHYEGVTLRAGADVENKRAQVSVRQRFASPIGGTPSEVIVEAPVAIATFSGVWAELLWEKDSPWTLVPGVRLDNYYLSGGQNAFVVEPRLTARRPLTESLQFKSGVGLYHQPPTTLISLPVVDLAAMNQGLQQSLQTSMGLEWRSPWGLEMSVEAYFNPMLRTVELTPFGDDEAEFVPPVDGGNPPPAPEPRPESMGGRVVRAQQDTPSFAPPTLPDMSSRGMAYGVEFLIRRPLGGNWFGWLSYSLQRSTRRVRFTRYDNMERPVGRAEADLPYVFDQTHVANLVLSYKFANNITVGGVVHFNTGRPESGNLTSRTMVPGQELDGLERWVRVDRDRVDRLPPFFRFDLRVSKAWAFDTFSLEAYMDMLNVTLSQEVVAYEYLGGYTEPLKRNPAGVPIALPIFGLKGRY